MKHVLFLLMVFLWSVAILGQGAMVPLPNYTMTYSFPAAVRGFYFKAPVDFEVVGLRVPDELKHGKQNIALYALAGPPSNYTPTARELLFFSAGQASNLIIPCQVKIKKDEWFCVLGMCGDATTSYTSYGSGSFSTSLFGKYKVTLNRLWMNNNLVSVKGIGAMTGTTFSSIGRVQVYLKQVQAARAIDYGAGSTMLPVKAAGHVPLPSFKRTYSTNSVRGFYVQAPCDFLVSHLEVPDETKSGIQNVALYRLLSRPAAWPGVTNVKPAFFKAMAVTGKRLVLMPPLLFKRGEWLGVLGACGTTMMHNSYGTVGPTSLIGGHKVVLNRLLMQQSFPGNNGIGSVSAEDSLPIARVKVFTNQTPVTVVPKMSTIALPVLGKTGSLNVDSRVGSTAAGFVFIGLGRSKVVTPLGTMLVNVPFLVGFPLLGGGGRLDLPIPNLPVLLGAGPLNLQGFFTWPLNFGTTNGVEWYLGN